MKDAEHCACDAANLHPPLQPSVFYSPFRKHIWLFLSCREISKPHLWSWGVHGSIISHQQQVFSWLEPPASSSLPPQLSSVPLWAPCTATLVFATGAPLRPWRCSSAASSLGGTWAWGPWRPAPWECWTLAWRCSSSAPCARAAGWSAAAPGPRYESPRWGWSSGGEAARPGPGGWPGGPPCSWPPVWPGSSGRAWGGCPPCRGWWSAAPWRAAGGWSPGPRNAACPHSGGCLDTPGTRATDPDFIISIFVALQ